MERRVSPVAGASILVVEDEAALATAVMDALHDAEYLADWAADGEQALAKVKAQSYDLVICDLKMPKLDGRAFYRSLSAAVPALSKRVVFVTAASPPRDRPVPTHAEKQTRPDE